MLKVSTPQSTDYQESKHCHYSVAMNIIRPGVGTAGHSLLQGRVVVILMGDSKKMILLGLSSLEYNPLEGVGRGFLPVGWGPQWTDETNFEPLQAVRYGMLKL